MGSRYDDRILGLPEVESWPVADMEFRDPHNGPWAWTQYLALRAAQKSVFLLPDFAQRGIAGALARVCKHLDPRHTRAAREFIQTALPELSEAEREEYVLQAWRHLFWVAVRSEGLPQKLFGRRFGDHFQLDLCPDAQRLFDSGQGCLLVTGHIGNWEVAGIPFNAMGLAPLYAVAKPPRNDPLARHIERKRQAQGGYVLPRYGAMKGVPTVVRAGGSVFMLLDHRARKRPLVAPFFGRPALCDRSAGVLMRRVAAPVALYACYEEGPWRYRLVVSSVLWPEDLSGLQPEAVAQRVNEEFERLILARPRQYFWLHDRYRNAPPPTTEGRPAAGVPAP